MDRDENEDEVLDEHADGGIENQGREKWSAGWFANSIIPRRISPLPSRKTPRYTCIFSRQRGVIVRDKKTICGFSSVVDPQEEVILCVYTSHGYTGGTSYG